MILGLRHAGIVVHDLGAMLRFYRDQLGCRELASAHESGRHIDAMLGMRYISVTTVKLSINGTGVIELLCFHSHGAPKKERWICDPGITHISLTVRSVDDEYRRLSHDHVRFINPPVISGSAKVAFAVDPEGNFVELVEDLTC